MAKKKTGKKKSAKKSAKKGSAKSAKKKGAKKKGAKKKTATKKTAKKRSAKKKSGARELIAPRGDRRFVRRDEQGQFEESDDAGRSLGQDRRKKAKRTVESGQGDRGDQNRGS